MKNQLKEAFKAGRNYKIKRENEVLKHLRDNEIEQEFNEWLKSRSKSEVTIRYNSLNDVVDTISGIHLIQSKLEITFQYNPSGDQTLIVKGKPSVVDNFIDIFAKDLINTKNFHYGI
jgi:hypothetical protein